MNKLYANELKNAFFCLKFIEYISNQIYFSPVQINFLWRTTHDFKNTVNLK